MLKPRYSIVIPTCERANILEYTIKGCLLQNYDSYELLVSDNYSQDNTKVILDSFKKDPKIRVVETKSRLAMHNHWEFAMSHALGEYIIILGDDDGVSHNLLMILDEIIDISGANIIRWQNCLYHHPDWPGTEANTLWINQKFSSKIHVILPKIVIKEYANYVLRFFPNLLQTCFSRNLYERARKKTGGRVFIGGPDYSCPALLLMDPKAKYVHIDAILGIGGRSKISNAAYLFSKDKSSAERYSQFIAEFENEDPFPYHQPKIMSISNVIFASLSYAMHFYPNVLTKDSINWIKLCERIHREILSSNGKDSQIDRNQVRNFYKFVKSLPRNQKKNIGGMLGYPSIPIKPKIIVERIKNEGKNIINSFSRFIPKNIKTKIKKIIRWSRNNSFNKPPKSPEPVFLDGSKYGFFNGEDVISKLEELVEIGENECFAHSNSIINKVESVKIIGKINNISNKNEISGQK